VNACFVPTLHRKQHSEKTQHSLMFAATTTFKVTSLISCELFCYKKIPNVPKLFHQVLPSSLLETSEPFILIFSSKIS